LPDVIEVVNRNKAIFEPFVDAVDEAMLNFNENARGFDIYGEQENDERKLIMQVRKKQIMKEKMNIFTVEVLLYRQLSP